jgi:hypothetical protein
MRLPEGFPHTRHEQYLMVLPVGLLTNLEREARHAVDRRLRRHLRRLIAPFLTEALSRGLTREDFATEFVARFEGPPPPVFARRPN